VSTQFLQSNLESVESKYLLTTSGIRSQAEFGSQKKNRVSAVLYLVIALS